MTPHQGELPAWAAALFPVFFALLWIVVTSLLGLFSGWFTLQAQFPPNDEPPLLRLRMQSGRMYSANLNGILTLDACTSGLRVSVWKLFGPFQRPFQVPWSEIEAEPVTRFLEPMVRLRLGRPEAGRLTIAVRSWERLKAASQGIAAPLTVATARRLGRGLFLQWLLFTVMIGGLFAFAAYSQGAPDIESLLPDFAFPAVAFGIVQSIRYLAVR